MLAPQCTDDSQLGEGRLATEHVDEAFELFAREPVLGDERGRDDGITGPGAGRCWE
jgi:hypothetical protein